MAKKKPTTPEKERIKVAEAKTRSKGAPTKKVRRKPE